MCTCIQSGLIVGSIKKAPHKVEVGGRWGGVKDSKNPSIAWLSELKLLVEWITVCGLPAPELMTLPIAFPCTGVQYTNWVRKRVASLTCMQAKSLGSEHMAGSRPGEAGDSCGRTRTPWLSRAVASRGGSTSSIPPPLIWMILWLLYHLGYSPPRVFFCLHSRLWFALLPAHPSPPPALLSLLELFKSLLSQGTMPLFGCIHTSKITNLLSTKIDCSLYR